MRMLIRVDALFAMLECIDKEGPIPAWVSTGINCITSTITFSSLIRKIINSINYTNNDTRPTSSAVTHIHSPLPKGANLPFFPFLPFLPYTPGLPPIPN
jgi:hypothetical protein